MKIAVVILNWNGKKYLEKFLPFVYKYNTPGTEIIVADNDSQDDSINFLKSNYPQVRIIQNTVNGGFAKGYNDALKLIDAEYYILLNSDVEVSDNWIPPLIDMMDKDLNIAACQPKIKSFDNRKYFEHAGAGGGYIDKYGFAFCRGRIFDTIEEDLGQYDDTREIFWATGACLFIRAELFHKAGGFDEDFFAHMEEIDICWQLKNMGYKIMYSPRSAIYHVGGGTLKYSSPGKTYLNFRNNLYLLYKNLPENKLYPVVFFRLVIDSIAGFKFLFEGNFRHFTAVIKAHFSFYKNFRKIAAKRKKIIPPTYPACVYNGSIVFDYFFRGKKTFKELFISDTNCF